MIKFKGRPVPERTVRHAIGYLQQAQNNVAAGGADTPMAALDDIGREIAVACLAIGVAKDAYRTQPDADGRSAIRYLERGIQS